MTFHTYTLSDPDFIHQHAVDAFAAQEADERTQPIKLVFALAGLHFAVDRSWTEREVQDFDLKMARHKRRWPKTQIPVDRGLICIEEVLRVKGLHEKKDLRLMQSSMGGLCADS